jgi:hypothetical protein
MKRLLIPLALASFASWPAAAQSPVPLPSPSVVDSARKTIVLTGENRDRLVRLRDGTGNFFLPVLTPDEAVAFWGREQSQSLTSGTVLFENEVIGASLELFSDIVGLFRLGIGVSVASADSAGATETGGAADTTGGEELSALTKLADNGGTIRLTAAFPLFFRRDNAAKSTWGLLFATSVGTEAPQSGAFLEDPAIGGQAGLELLYQRGGAHGRIDVEFGAVARAYRFNEAYAVKVGAAQRTAYLFAPRFGLILLGNTRLGLVWRVSRSATFDHLGTFAVVLQQVR